jgi:hypothetical protein
MNDARIVLSAADQTRRPATTLTPGPMVTMGVAPGEGWWKLAGLQGTREGVRKAITAANIPEHWKAALLVDVNLLPANCNFAAVDAHYHLVGGKRSLHVTVSGKPGLV